MKQIFQILKQHPVHLVKHDTIHSSAQIINKIEIPKMIGFPPLDAPPGKNLLILSCRVFIISSMFGGVGPLLPEPLPPPPGGDPHGTSTSTSKIVNHALYIVSLLGKTSLVC